MKINVDTRCHRKGMLKVLVKPPKSHLPPAKDVFHHPEYMLHPRANPRLPPIPLLLPLAQRASQAKRGRLMGICMEAFLSSRTTDRTSSLDAFAGNVFVQHNSRGFGSSQRFKRFPLLRIKSPLVRRLGRKIEKNCSRRGKSTLFSTPPAGKAFSRPFGNPVIHARWGQRNGFLALSAEFHKLGSCCRILLQTVTSFSKPSTREPSLFAERIWKVY